MDRMEKGILNILSHSISDRKTISRYLLGWGFYFFILLSIAYLFGGSPLESWTKNLVDAANVTGYGDPNSFASAAMDVSQHGWVTQNTRYVFNLWPPGFVILEAMLLKVFGSAAAMPLLLLFCSAALFSALMMEMQRFLKSRVGFWSWIFPILIFTFSTARVFILSITGLLFGEWLAIGCFFCAILVLTRLSVRAIIFSGFLFAASAYARSQFEFFLGAMLVVAAGAMATDHFFKKFNLTSFFKLSKYLVLSLIVAQIFMAPWRLLHIRHGADGRWVYASDYLVSTSLKTDEALLAGGAGWMVDGGVNVACHIAPEHCGKDDAGIYKRIFIENPLLWVGAKVRLLPKYWFSTDGYLTGPTVDTFWGGVFNGLFLLLLVGSICLHWVVRKGELVPLLLSVTAGLLMAHSVIITFSHLEVRYFYFLKLYGVFSFILLAAEWVKLNFRKPSNLKTENF